jgi:hypothetical protein
MKYILLILPLFLFASCVTQKRCAQKFPPQIITKTETITETVYRDTTIYVHIPADTIYSEKVIFKSPEGWQTELSVLDQTYAKSTAQVVNGTLKHELFQKQTEIERVISNAIKENSTHTVDTIVKIHEVPYIPAWHKFASKFTIIVLVLLFALGLFKFVR